MFELEEETGRGDDRTKFDLFARQGFSTSRGERLTNRKVKAHADSRYKFG